MWMPFDPVIIIHYAEAQEVHQSPGVGPVQLGMNGSMCVHVHIDICNLSFNII